MLSADVSQISRDIVPADIASCPSLDSQLASLLKRSFFEHSDYADFESIGMGRFPNYFEERSLFSKYLERWLSPGSGGAWRSLAKVASGIFFPNTLQTYAFSNF